MVREWLKNTTNVIDLGFVKIPQNRPQMVCADGFTMSVQASEMHYCTPRETLLDGQYDDVEIGFPSAKEELLMKYAEDIFEPTETVYAYVPVDVLEKVIEKHGGISVRETEE